MHAYASVYDSPLYSLTFQFRTKSGGAADQLKGRLFPSLETKQLAWHRAHSVRAVTSSRSGAWQTYSTFEMRFTPGVCVGEA